MNTEKSSVLLPWAAQTSAKRLNITKAEGSYFWLNNQHDNRDRILDMCAQIFNANIGHGHERIKKKIIEYSQDPRVMLPNAENKYAESLAQKLGKVAFPNQNNNKTFFTLGGAETAEHAIKIARMVTGRHKIVTRFRSYHGSTIAAMNHSGDPRRIPTEGGISGVIRFPDPYELGSGQKIDTVRLLEEIIQIEGPQTIAAVMLEGITGTNGVFVPEDDYWLRVQKLCNYHGIMLIADEVLSGCGRTGKWLGINHYDVTPDIITLSKGLAGGYAPLGSVTCSEKITEHFDNNPIFSGLTGYAPELSCALADECFDIYFEEKLLENAEKRGQELKIFLNDMAQNLPNLIAETRSIGLLAAIDLKPLKKFEFATPIGKSQEDVARIGQIKAKLLENKIYTFAKPDMIFISPPLCITKDELSDGMQKVRAVLKRF